MLNYQLLPALFVPAIVLQAVWRLARTIHRDTLRHVTGILLHAIEQSGHRSLEEEKSPRARCTCNVTVHFQINWHAS